MLATEMHKVINNLSPSIMKEIFPMPGNHYNLQNKNPFETHNVHSVYNGTESLAYTDPKIWVLVPLLNSYQVSKTGNWGCSYVGSVRFTFLIVIN